MSKEQLDDALDELRRLRLRSQLGLGLGLADHRRVLELIAGLTELELLVGILRRLGPWAAPIDVDDQAHELAASPRIQGGRHG